MKEPALPLLPNNLTPIKDLLAALKSDESLFGLSSKNQEIISQALPAAHIAESSFEKLIATGADLEKLALEDVIIARSDLTAVSASESSWRRIKITETRCSGIKLQNSTLKDLTIDGCKLDISNFRYSKLKNVTFIDCSLDEADFYMANLENVRFENCTFKQAEFSGATCKAVDFRTSDITLIRGLDSLAHATISSEQLMAIAPALASRFQIIVSDE